MVGGVFALPLALIDGLPTSLIRRLAHHGLVLTRHQHEFLSSGLHPLEVGGRHLGRRRAGGRRQRLGRIVHGVIDQDRMVDLVRGIPHSLVALDRFRAR